MIKMTIQDTEETAEFKVLEKPIIQKPLIAESDVVTIDNNLSTYVTGTQKRELTVGLGYLDSVGYETLRRIRDRQYAVLKYPTVTITADEPVDLAYGEDVPDYRQRLVQLKGKNLFDKNNPNMLTAYIDGNQSVITNNNLNRTVWIPCEPNTTYTVQRLSPPSWNRGLAWTETKPAAGIQTYGYVQGNSSSLTITTGATAKYLVYRVYQSHSDSSTTLDNVLASVQIEKGSAATTYEAYFNIELCKIGDYQDRIYKSGDKWYVHKETNTIPLLSTYNWYTSNQSIKFYSDVLPECNHSYTTSQSTPLYECWSEIYPATKVVNILNGGTGIGLTGISGGGGDHAVVAYVPKASYTVDSWKVYLDTVSAYLTYILQTPTNTEITNETLIAQLNALQNSAFDRWTQIETSVQDPSLQPYLTVTQGDITDSGKEVMLDGTTEDLLDFVILGDTFQQTYSGKNLAHTSFTNETANGVTKTLNDDGSITLNGHTTSGHNFVATTEFALTAGQTYTMSAEVLGGSFTPYRDGQEWAVMANIRQPGGTTLRSMEILSSGNLASYTPTTSGNYIISLWFGYSLSTTTTDAVFNNFRFRLQFEAGSTATAFEPYVGGVPAPNPDYPQEVQTVNDNINFDFSGPSGVKKYTMVGKMTLADQRVIDNCGTNEQVQVSFRESKQL